MNQKHYYHPKEKNHLMITWKKSYLLKSIIFLLFFSCLALCCLFDSMDAGLFYID